MSLHVRLDCYDATWGELRQMVALANMQGIHDDEPVDTWDQPLSGDFGGFELEVKQVTPDGP